MDRIGNLLWLTLLVAVPLTSARADDAAGGTIALQQRPSGSFYVEGLFAGAVQTPLLVDTGSGYVALAPETFARIRAASPVTHVRDITGALANGSLQRVPVYRVSTLQLGGSCSLDAVEVVVMPGSTSNILGLSALRRLAPFTLDVDPAALHVSGCTTPAPAGPLLAKR